jgi:hypothetical protein
MATKTKPAGDARAKKHGLGRATGHKGGGAGGVAVASVFTVATPQAAQQTKVRVSGATGFICAQGVAISDTGDVPSAVWARVYQGTPDPSTIPASPPTDPQTFGVIPVQVPGGANPLGYWNFDQTNFRDLPGAAFSAVAPGAQNTLVLWFTWPEIGNVALSVPFFGFDAGDGKTQCMP